MLLFPSLNPADLNIISLRKVFLNIWDLPEMNHSSQNYNDLERSSSAAFTWQDSGSWGRS